VGNGSSAVVVTRVLRQVGGWDTSLRDGDEDYKTFFLTAERGNLAVVAMLSNFGPPPLLQPTVAPNWIRATFCGLESQSVFVRATPSGA
jgi:hypothetical protein